MLKSNRRADEARARERTQKQSAAPGSAAHADPQPLIAARAYELFELRRANGHAGDAVSDWLQAEREIVDNAPEPFGSAEIEAKRQPLALKPTHWSD